MALQLLSDGWDYHATQSERLAGELEAAAATPVGADDLVPFVRLATHTIGEHLEDWPRARRLDERLLAGRAPDAATAKAWAHLSIARSLAGDPAGAAEAELTFLGAAADFRAALIEARFMLVAALVGCGRSDEAIPLFRAALELARGLGEAAPARAVAVASNNLGYDLVEEPTRTPDEDAVMRLAADAALEFWRKCGTWKQEAAALTLTARVANLLGEPDRALADADAALAVIAAGGEAPAAGAILRVVRSASLGLKGDAAGQAHELAEADRAAAALEDPDAKAFYDDQRRWIVG
jgi:tetratricopeptide (TPR) repeat protein